ncbi:hypothetical protein JTE90_010635 [Oedothorax gibbosus]|uniref:BZIP domain-containing protein n=1 Tax=Oedothorax gibbosus TaxID=931172 RepID=A0AAV6VIN8_9ARAC|nr:hypothetical protein JTE90_010635 [Oedothorax gibbosus]
MDTTFYEDSGMKVMRGMKRPMTLDLDGAAAKGSKNPRVNNLLTSPDLNMLKLGSPELEKLIIAHNSGFPGDNWKTTNPCMYPKNDEYTRDFNDALSSLQQVTSSSNNLNLYQPQQQQMHQQQPDLQNLVNVSNCNGMMPQIPCSTTIDSYGGYHQQQPLSSINMNCNPMVSSSSMNNNTNCYDPNNGGYYEPVVNIKEEPQTVPCMGLSPPPHSPIDMEDQERLKLERKRLRNRIAASKCRRRKLERIARLEDKVANLKSENSDLVNHVARLRDCICQLKQQVMDHVRSGCEILVSSTYPTDL